MKRILFWCFVMCLAGCSGNKDDSFEKSVSKALAYQMKEYPESTLKDIYKNFFQDVYGPGHLLRDTAAAGNYLRRELASYNTITGPYFEPTGREGKFYRVNLSVIKQNLISYEAFFDAFVRSVQGIEPMPVAQWKEEWNRIEQVIEKEYPDINGFAEDKASISELLDKGEYVVHHSENFEKKYTPHYRIIEKSIFEKEILPLLP